MFTKTYGFRNATRAKGGCAPLDPPAPRTLPGVRGGPVEPDERSSSNERCMTMARPRKGDEGLTDENSKVVSFRLHNDVHAAYVAKVKKLGMTRSEFMRDYVLENKTQAIARPIASLEKKRMLFLVNKISNNINQMAHRANSEAQAGVIKESTYLDMLDELSRMNAFLNKVVGNVD